MDRPHHAENQQRALTNVFSIVSYRDAHQPQINRLMGAAPSKERIWHWQFQENPFGYRFDPVVLMDDGRVVGFNGVMAVDVLYNNEQTRVLWSCDFYVDRDYRGKGLGRMIKNALHEKSDIIMSFGISKMAAPVLLKMGWHSSGEVYVFRKYRAVRSYRQVLASLVQLFNTVRGSFSRCKGRRLECRVCDSLPARESIDALWEIAGPGYRKIVVRNHAYLHWRYERHPLGRYRFVHVVAGDELRAIGVLRHGRGTAHLVDMLVSADDRAARNAIVAAMLDLDPECATFACSTSDRLLSSCLQDHGFFKARKQPRFFVRSADASDTDCEQGWFIMDGDSDGDMLAAAQVLDAIRIKEIADPAEFRAMEASWNELLERSDANQLFMSWAWQYSWWETWGDAMGLDMYLLVASRGNDLVGIAPLYFDKVLLGDYLPVVRLQFIGNAFRRQGTVRTEYMEFITARDCENDVCQAILEYMSVDRRWDEFIVCDMPGTSRTFRSILDQRDRKKWLVFVRDSDRGIKVNTEGRFGDYLSGLGKNTRHKLFGRRKYLQKTGNIEVTSSTMATLDEYFAVLNRFQRARMGRDCFSADSLLFHKRLLHRLTAGQDFELACIQRGNAPVSIIYNISSRDTVYNIQSGFDEHFDAKLSMGTLHLGLAIEHAFADPGTKAFDMLAGSGKKEYYKSRFHGDEVEFITLQVARKRLLKVLYTLYLRLPGIFKGRDYRAREIRKGSY